MKCYESSTASATSTATVAAGSSIGFVANGPIYHAGVCLQITLFRILDSQSRLLVLGRLLEQCGFG